jgi:predicted phage terminase large subunit-like protein
MDSEKRPDLRALARADLAAYAAAIRPDFECPPHIALLIDRLEALERGEIKRLAISMPPRHGKSETSSVTFVAWALGRRPGRKVVFGAYGQEFAESWGRRVRNIIASPVHRAIFPESQLSSDSTAAGRFDLTRGGAYVAAGRSTGVTGRGADLVVLDDVIAGQEEARSATILENTYTWFQRDVFTRRSPRARIVVIGTRWDERDLIGRLLTDHKEEGWVELRLPALSEGEGDPLGRPEGAALWPQRFDEEALEATRRQIGSWAFEALYQARPSPPGGGIVKRSWWQYHRTTPGGISQLVQSWDLAFKETSDSDFVVGQVWGRREGEFFLLDQVRDRMDFPTTCNAILQMRAKWPRAYAILVEDKANGPAVIDALKRRVPGLIAVNPEGGKQARVHASAPLIESGAVSLPEGAPWVQDFIAEFTSFPKGRNDDQVDAATQALLWLFDFAPSTLGKVTRSRLEPVSSPGVRRSSWEDEDLQRFFDPTDSREEAEQRRRNGDWGERGGSASGGRGRGGMGGF